MADHIDLNVQSTADQIVALTPTQEKESLPSTLQQDTEDSNEENHSTIIIDQDKHVESSLELASEATNTKEEGIAAAHISPETFPQFGEFPLELRLHIWRYAVLQPRVIKVVHSGPGVLKIIYVRTNSHQCPLTMACWESRCVALSLKKGLRLFASFPRSHFDAKTADEDIDENVDEDVDEDADDDADEDVDEDADGDADEGSDEYSDEDSDEDLDFGEDTEEHADEDTDEDTDKDYELNTNACIYTNLNTDTLWFQTPREDWPIWRAFMIATSSLRLEVKHLIIPSAGGSLREALLEPVMPSQFNGDILKIYSLALDFDWQDVYCLLGDEDFSTDEGGSELPHLCDGYTAALLSRGDFAEEKKPRSLKDIDEGHEKGFEDARVAVIQKLTAKLKEDHIKKRKIKEYQKTIDRLPTWKPPKIKYIRRSQVHALLGE